MKNNNNDLCAVCGGSGALPGAMHYVGLGTSEVTFCARCPRGHQRKGAWTIAPKQVAYRRNLAKAKARRALESSHLGLPFATARIGDFEVSRSVYTTLQDYVRDWPAQLANGRGLYLFGPTGVGKSHAISAVARQLVDTHLVETLLLSVPVFATRLRQFVTTADSRKATALLSQAKRVQLLVLDDLGLERSSGWIDDLLYQVVDERWRQRRPMILASGYSPAQLHQRYRPQLVSRVRGSCQKIEMAGPDRRAK